MHEDLKQTGNSVAAKRSFGGLLGSAGFFAIVFFNLFGMDEAALGRWKWISLAMCAFFAVVVIKNWVNASKGGPIAGIEKFCKATDNPDAMLLRMEKTWQNGVRVKSTRMDKEYAICVINMKSMVIPFNDVFWAYKSVSRTNGIEYSCLKVVFNNGKGQDYTLNSDQALINAILNHIAENCPHIITGYSDEMGKLYSKRDMAGLKEYARIRKIGLEV